jgi:hypothetical protein
MLEPTTADPRHPPFLHPKRQSFKPSATPRVHTDLASSWLLNFSKCLYPMPSSAFWSASKPKITRPTFAGELMLNSFPFATARIAGPTLREPPLISAIATRFLATRQYESSTPFCRACRTCSYSLICLTTFGSKDPEVRSSLLANSFAS